MSLDSQLKANIWLRIGTGEKVQRKENQNTPLRNSFDFGIDHLMA
jgi:hypothetical protein